MPTISGVNGALAQGSQIRNSFLLKVTLEPAPLTMLQAHKVQYCVQY